jgi:hypothetical protein
LAAGVSSTPPADLAELSLAIFGMRIYPTSHRTAGFALLGAWRACATLVVGMELTYYVDP